MHEVALLCTSWTLQRDGNWFEVTASQINWLCCILYIVCMCVQSLCPMLVTTGWCAFRAWPRVKRVYHIGDEGKHLEELEESTSYHERKRDSIPARCRENVLAEVFGQSQCQYQCTFQDKTCSCETQ